MNLAQSFGAAGLTTQSVIEVLAVAAGSLIAWGAYRQRIRDLENWRKEHVADSEQRDKVIHDIELSVKGHDVMLASIQRQNSMLEEIYRQVIGRQPPRQGE